MSRRAHSENFRPCVCVVAGNICSIGARQEGLARSSFISLSLSHSRKFPKGNLRKNISIPLERITEKEKQS
jgi:hypothetical protein